eukprot:8681660-Pyramimonas_sp.AAC.1
MSTARSRLSAPTESRLCTTSAAPSWDDSPAALLFARAFRHPIQSWLDPTWMETWRGEAPLRPTTYAEWTEAELVPPPPPTISSRTARPSEALCTAWVPILQRPVDLSCRVYADDTSKTRI